MPKSKVYKKTDEGDIKFNMTPLIDCTFLLIIFFVLTSSVISPALVQLQLHRPTKSQATEEKKRDEQSNRVIVNVLSMVGEDEENATPALSAQCKGYRIFSKTIEPGDTDELKKELKRLKTSAMKNGTSEKDFIVEIRSDHRVNYESVKPVMKAASLTGIHRMNITALTD